MKLRNLEAEYDNLHPEHVMNTLDDEDEKMAAYQKLWDYARKLELNVLAERKKSQKYKENLQAANAALWRKHEKVKAAKNFLKAFKGMF